MTIGFDYWQVISHYPKQFRHLSKMFRANGDPEMFTKSSAACYAWFIWEKDYKGNPEVLWI